MVDLKTGGHLKCPKKCEGFILHVMEFVCFWTAPESVIFIFDFVLDFKSVTCLLLEKPPPQLNVRKFWNASFSHLNQKIEKMKHFKIFEHKKWGISRRTHVIDLKPRKESKINSILGHFKNKYKCYRMQHIFSTYYKQHFK